MPRNKVRVVYRKDGGVSVVTPAPKSQMKDEPDQEWIDRVFARAMEADPDIAGLEYDDIDKSELPKDRKDRDAWIGSKGKGVKICPVRKGKHKKKEKIDARVTAKAREDAIKDLIQSGDLPHGYIEEETYV